MRPRPRRCACEMYFGWDKKDRTHGGQENLRRTRYRLSFRPPSEHLWRTRYPFPSHHPESISRGHAGWQQSVCFARKGPARSLGHEAEHLLCFECRASVDPSPSSGVGGIMHVRGASVTPAGHQTERRPRKRAAPARSPRRRPTPSPVKLDLPPPFNGQSWGGDSSR